MERTEFKSHISEKYNENLENLFNQALEMGGMVEAQLKNAVEAIKDENKKLAKEVKQIDKIVNKSELEIDRLCACVLARQEPKASDLRLIVSTIRIAVDLERIGDEAVSGSKIAIKMAKEPESSIHALPGYKQLLDMAAIDISMLEKVLTGFAQLDLAEISDVVDDQNRVTELKQSALSDIQKYLDNKETGGAEHAMQMIHSIRSFYRVAAHIVNIAESIIYLVKGHNVRNMNSQKLIEFLNNLNHDL